MNKIVFAILFSFITTTASAQVAARTVGAGKSYAESGYKLYDWTQKTSDTTIGYWPQGFTGYNQKKIRNISQSFTTPRAAVLVYSGTRLFVKLTAKDICDSFFEGDIESTNSTANEIELDKNTNKKTGKQNITATLVINQQNAKGSTLKFFIDPSDDCIYQFSLDNIAYFNEAMTYFSKNNHIGFGSEIYAVLTEINQKLNKPAKLN